MTTKRIEFFQQPVRIKICGITNLSDAEAAVTAGADALGFVFWKKSPRYVSAIEAGGIAARLPPFVAAVGVFVDEKPDVINSTATAARLSCIQLHGDETPEFCGEVARITGRPVIKALRVSSIEDAHRLKDYAGLASALLLDAYVKGSPGGTGKTFDWKIAVEAKKYGRIILSGGLTPDNVADALRAVSPYAVDVSSGVEAAPGRKDHAKIKRFIAEIRKEEA